jgi:hypothetical protein
LEETLTTGQQTAELLASLLDPMPDGGISVLAEVAVPAVQRHGICVYERTEVTRQSIPALGAEASCFTNDRPPRPAIEAAARLPHSV